ncbi:MAG: hypothetical protein F6K19_01375 [Cyanothece sp. SIO1E1]|nr:hypothetical protein [Cyanothece sp. SIO1E1]
MDQSNYEGVEKYLEDNEYLFSQDIYDSSTPDVRPYIKIIDGDREAMAIIIATGKEKSVSINYINRNGSFMIEKILREFKNNSAFKFIEKNVYVFFVLKDISSKKSNQKEFNDNIDYISQISILGDGVKFYAPNNASNQIYWDRFFDRFFNSEE